jgi:shikimate kinase/shikimate kinase/3-dehydroquinate synthase
MESKENIVFLGMMGSGKTSIGLLISKKLNLEFYDIDQIIEKELEMSISDIFEKKGEKFFRDFEEKTTLKILKKKWIVISLGGGAFINKKIREEILKNHLSFWLNWNSKTLIRRIKRNTNRPIALKSSTNELVNLIKKRSVVYSKSKYKINCEKLSKNEIVNEIIDIYENKKINS